MSAEHSSRAIPEGEKSKFTGFQGKLGVTTSAWLFNPEQAFAVTHALNNGRPEEDWIGIELYNTMPVPAVHAVLDRIPGIKNFNPPRISPDVISKYQREYPRTRVDQVHLEFNASQDEAAARVGRGVIHRNGGDVRHAAWMYIFPSARAQHGVRLAEELGVGVNAHVNVVEAFAEEGSLVEIQKRLAFVQAENENPYPSRYGNRLRHRGISSEQLISDPAIIRREIVHKYDLDGLLLGVDHALIQGSSPVNAMIQTADVLSRIHIAGVENGGSHTSIEVGNPVFERFFSIASHVAFRQPVSVAFDGNPLEFRKITLDEQVEKLDKLFSWIEKTQGRT